MFQQRIVKMPLDTQTWRKIPPEKRMAIETLYERSQMHRFALAFDKVTNPVEVVFEKKDAIYV